MLEYQGFLRKEMNKQEKDYVKLDIDKSKIVTRINTDNLEKNMTILEILHWTKLIYLHP